MNRTAVDRDRRHARALSVVHCADSAGTIGAAVLNGNIAIGHLDGAEVVIRRRTGTGNAVPAQIKRGALIDRKLRGDVVTRRQNNRVVRSSVELASSKDAVVIAAKNAVVVCIHDVETARIAVRYIDCDAVGRNVARAAEVDAVVALRRVQRTAGDLQIALASHADGIHTARSDGAAGDRAERVAVC